MAVAAAANVRSSFRELVRRPEIVERLVFVTGIVLLLSGVCTAVLCPWLMKVSFSPTPYADQWAILHDISGGNKWYSLSWLWKQHNEHRVPLLRLMMYADLDWFGGHAYLLYAMTFITLLWQWAMWAAFVRTIPGLGRAIWISIAGFLGFCFLCPNQYQNFYLAIQWTFVAAFFFASAAFIALPWFATRGQPWRAVVLSSLAAFLAECSLASGILTWPILWLASLGLPVRRRHRTVLGVVGAVAIALYLYHYWQPPYHSDPLETIRHPLLVAQYVTRYIDYCLSAYFIYAGLPAIVLSLAAVGALIVLLRRPNTRAAGVALATSMCFVLATAAMTGLGRLKFGLVQAEDSRYQTPVMLYWGCAFAALIIAAWELRSWRDVLALNMAAMAAIFVPIGNLRPLIDIVRARADVVSLTGESLDQGVVDPVLEEKQIFFAIVIATRYLHAHGFKVGPNAPDVPRPIVMSKWDQGGCIGRLDTVAPLSRFEPGPPEVRVEGWAINNKTHGPLRVIAVVDDHGTVLAESSLHFDRLDVLAAHPETSGRVGWHIYVPLSKQSKQLRAVAVVDDHGCPLSNIVTVPGEHQ